MKKVLIIGTIWPYQHGGVRVPGLAKYLPEFGWEPVVLTMPLPGKPRLEYRVVETPFHDVLHFFIKRFVTTSEESTETQLARKVGLTANNPVSQFIFHFLRDIVTYPDIYRGWQAPGFKAGGGLIEKEGVKAIISASPPVMTNIIARKLKERYKIPWLGDFPHLWSQNNFYPYSELRRKFDKRLELKTLSQADALTTTAEPLAEKIRTLHQEKNVYVITHGFDPETENTLPDRLTDKFTITYTGGFATVLREPDMLLAALQELIAKGAIDPGRIEVRFYGTKEDWVNGQIEKYGLSGVVRQYGKVPMPESLARQRESQLLFNPKWNDPQEPGIHSMKILEYLAARRPILATGRYHDVVDDLLEETGAGVCTSSVEDTTKALEKAYQEYLSRGQVAWHGDAVKTGYYSHRAMAGRFAAILDQLIGHKSEVYR